MYSILCNVLLFLRQKLHDCNFVITKRQKTLFYEIQKIVSFHLLYYVLIINFITTIWKYIHYKYYSYSHNIERYQYDKTVEKYTYKNWFVAIHFDIFIDYVLSVTNHTCLLKVEEMTMPPSHGQCQVEGHLN